MNTNLRIRQLVACGWIASLFFFASPSCPGQEDLSAEQLKFFETKIRPVLIRECYSCHSTKSQVKGGLWLDTKSGTQDGGDSGPAVVPGDLNESLLWNAINHIDYRMPPRKKLSDEIIADFKKWIEMGAPDPRIRKTQTINSSITQADIEEGKKFWSFKRPEKQSVPEDHSDWSITDIDRFIAERLNAEGLDPTEDADVNTFLRRLTFDLIGLPPTPKQISWLAERWDDDRESAIATIVDTLLARKEFGERWGRHWLDVARYAESTGKELNTTYPTAWRYRDYVIDSFNKDKPYDRFVREQIAGDLLPAKNDEQWAENLIGTGFLAIGPKTLTEQNGRQFELDLVDEQIDVATRVVLGVSVACARCHDHKFDPIPQEDYYAMAGIFQSTSTHYGTLDTFQNRRPSNLLILPVSDLGEGAKKLTKKEMEDLKEQLAAKEEEFRNNQRERIMARRNGGAGAASIQEFARVSNQLASLRASLNNYDKRGNPITYTMGVQDLDRPADAKLLERGEFDKPAQTVKRGFPQVLDLGDVQIEPRSSGRLELAKWMTDPANPLTARVMVNRIWQHMFGQGLVRSPENFGATGLRPTHPELLDYLAIEFIENGWSVKKLIRTIATSRAYRMSSEFDRKSFETDPENRYVWRMEPKRLDAEALRDSILMISGELDNRRPRSSIVAQAGDSIIRNGSLFTGSRSGSESMASTTQAMRFRGGQSAARIISLEQPAKFRSVYLPVVRDAVTRSMEVFDFAEPSMVVGKREASNTPDQGLYFLNNQFVMDQSDAIADRLMKEENGVREQVELMFLLAYGRSATAGELRAAKEFYDQFRLTRDNAGQSRFGNSRLGGRFRSRGINSAPTGATNDHQKLSALCQAILASAEFRYLN